MPTIESIFDDVKLLCGEVGGRPLRLPLLLGSDGAMLIDSGCAPHVQELILPALVELDIPPERLRHLIVTHSDIDHQGGNSGLRAVCPDLRIGCGRADAAAVSDPEVIIHQRYDAYRAAHDHHYDDAAIAGIRRELGQPTPVDLTCVGGEQIHLGAGWIVEIVHLPGHSHGHIGVYDPKHRTLFGGDAIHGDVYLDLSGRPALCPTYLHIAEYRQTIDHIARLPIDCYIGCHWPTLRGREIQAFCDQSRDFVDRVEALVLQHIRERSADTLTALCERVGPRVGRWPAGVHREMCYAISGHLEDLAARGLIRAIPGGRPRRYEPLGGNDA